MLNINLNFICPFYFINSSKLLSYLLLILDGYCLTAIASVGITLNTIGLIHLLTKGRKEKMFNLLLSALLVFDTLFLVCSLIISIGTNFISIPKEFFRVYYLVAYPGLRCSLISSIFMTILLTYSRYRAVSKPIHYRNALLLKKDRIETLFKYVSTVLFIAILLTCLLYTSPSPRDS